MAEHGQSSSTWNDAEAKKLPEKVEEMESKGEIPGEDKSARKRLVVVGLGMVGVAFMSVYSRSNEFNSC
jgi:nitrite reductase (NAD(P)H)